ncbi:MAG: tRNA (N(6)-L-threonylcarbamoyladenosine(37)-C(2))-methylthiotransferase MtaB [Pirellulaceae bacterium]
MSGKLKTLTLGCKLNQYETQYIREGLELVGYTEVPREEPAELCIVNTCTVTNAGDSKSRKAIRQLARENPDSRIVVMGCYATRAPEEVLALPNVVEVVTDKRELPDILGRFGVIDIPTGISNFGNRHRAYIKIQDGCMLRCSYCIIPHVRPELTSRPLEHILDEARRLIDNGYRELVLTGVHIGHYGVDWNFGKPREQWIRLADLTRQIALLPGDFRIRISSIEATEVTRELIAVLGEHAAKIVPHLHICLQSGSDAVLRRMRRRWGTQTFLQRCNLVRDTLDNPAITTDIITGFPGETDAEFAEGLATIRSAAFSKIHVFPFSARKGTPAADMDNQLPKSLKKQRGREIAMLAEELQTTYYQSLVGKKLEVLVEAEDRDKPQHYVGTSCRYAPVEFPWTPELSGQVDQAGNKNPIGKLVAVTATATAADRVYGNVITS